MQKLFDIRTASESSIRNAVAAALRGTQTTEEVRDQIARHFLPETQVLSILPCGETVWEVTLRYGNEGERHGFRVPRDYMAHEG